MSTHDAMRMPAALPLGETVAPSWSTGKHVGVSREDEATIAGSDDARSGSAQSPVDELAPGTAIGRYMILSRLGAGAMGVVYAAYDPELDRKVALKLLHSRGGSSLDSRLRLMREAKALARLSHPNVVAVHDVGTFADHVFLAMEFVDGKTLGAWLKERPQAPWQEVLAIMRKAGEGLAAAHAAGLIHRDFKPDNVLIARDGRVRVLDFGLARSAAELTPEEQEPDPAAAAVLASVSSERRGRTLDVAMLTRTGALVGTPAYMSPEQHLGRFADCRSDQFSFCVATYQALYGARPFVGERMSSLAFQVLQGKISPPPAGNAVPMWLRRIVLRGLSVDPDLRYPGMLELLADLDHDRGLKRRRGWFVAGAAVVTMGLGLGLYAATPAPEPPCRGAEQRLAGAWDEPRIAALEAAFHQSPLPYAAETWTTLRPSLQSYADEWTRIYTESCEATRVRGEQSDTLLDLRTRCLDRRLVELRALTDVLVHGELAAIEKAGEGVSRLGDLATCSDTNALLAVVDPPAGDLALAVDRVTGDIARASALELAGRWLDARALTTAALADPATAAYPPLAADAHRVHARVLRLLGEPAEAADSLLAAIDAAARGHDDRAAAEAWTDLVFVVGYDLNQAERTAAYTRAAEAALARVGADPLMHARLDTNISGAQVRLGDLDAALAAGERALRIFEADPRADPSQHHRMLGNLGLILKARKDYKQARAHLERALRMVRSVSGHDHPSAATILTNLGALALDEGDLDVARAHADEAAAIRRRAFPSEHGDLAQTEELFAGIAEARGDNTTAAAHYRRALEIYSRGPHPSPAKLASLHNAIAILAVFDGRLADALPEYRSALDGFRAVSGVDNTYAVTVEANLAETLLALGRPDEALPLQAHVVETHQRKAGADHPETAGARVQHAQILHALGRPADARALLESALDALARAPEADRDRGRLGLGRYTLARCLADLHQDRPRQRQLADLAADDLATDSTILARRALADLNTWRAHHPSP